MKENITPEKAIALLSIARDLTLATVEKNYQSLLDDRQQGNEV